MRPALLNPLFAPVTSLAGVGPKQDKLFRYLLGRDDTPRLVDLLLHLPTSVIDRRARPRIRDAVPGTVVTLEVTVDRHRPAPGGRSRAPYLVYASDDSGDVVLTYFRAQPGYVEKLLPVGSKRYVSGTLQMFDGIPQIVHPDRVVDEANFAKLSGIDPVYPLTEGLALGSLRRAVAQALQKLPNLPEWISPEILRRCRFPPIAAALNRLHVPVELTDILPDGPFWSRLAFDELLAGQLALALVRAQLRRPAGDRHAGDGHLRNKIIDALPYALTSSQRQASAAIAEDLRQPVRMLRLLQGDVGSGKTVVALLAAAAVAEAGQAGGVDGADGNPGAPAYQDHHAAGRTRRPAGRDPDRPRERQGAPRCPGPAGRRRDRSAGRHPRADPGRRRIQGAGAGCRRRAASLWGARTPRAHRQGRGGRRAGAERHADPAHAGADLFRRHGRLGVARKASRTTADRYPHGAEQPPQRGDGRRRPGTGGRQTGLLDLPAGGGIRSRGHRSPDQCHRAVREPAKALRRPASAWCMAR